MKSLRHRSRLVLRRAVARQPAGRGGNPEPAQGRARAVHLAGLLVLPAGRPVARRTRQAERPHRARLSRRLLGLYRLDRHLWRRPPIPTGRRPMREPGARRASTPRNWSSTAPRAWSARATRKSMTRSTRRRSTVPVELVLERRHARRLDRRAGGGRTATVWLVTFKDHAAGRASSAARMPARPSTTRRSSPAGRCWACGMPTPAPISSCRSAELMTDGSNGAVILVQSDKDGLPGADPRRRQRRSSSRARRGSFPLAIKQNSRRLSWRE